VSAPEPQEGVDISSFVIANLYETSFVFDDRTPIPQIKASDERIEESVTEGDIEEEVQNEREEPPSITPTITSEPLTHSLDLSLYTPLMNEAEAKNNEPTIQENESGEEETLNEIPEITPEPTPLPDPPIPKMTVEPQTGLAPLRVSFADVSIGEITEWIWIFGDGLSSVDANPIHMYEKPGEYTVYLTVAGPGGAVRIEEPVQISVVAPWISPYASFMADPVEGMVPLTVQFTDTSTGDVEERIWTFGDKTEAKDPIVEHTYTRAGTYPVSLTVTGYDGTTDRSGGFIAVLPLPDPPVPEIGCSTISSLEIACNATISSDSEGVSWLWEFGDGSQSTEPEVVHTYEAFETYVISVTVTDAYEQSGFSSIELSLDLPPLDATFTYENDSQQPLTIIFTGVGEVETWNWEFGDGAREIGQVVTHTYNTTGEMNVALTIADAYQQKEVTQIVTISAPPLDALFTYESDSQQPMTIIFTGVGEAETWDWEFGDGAREAGQVVTHTYNTTGEMNVALTIADAYQQKEVKQILTVYAPPIDVDFAITLSDASEPYAVSFFDRSYGPITTWQWYFGDGAASKEQNPVHVYGNAGEYTVQLIITSEYGDTKMQQVRFIIPDSVPDERVSSLSKPDIDLNDKETVVKPIAEVTEV
jgi:PKD repeat protein